MAKIDIHIGLEKTGSTSIQTFLVRNRGALARQGICFPRSPGNGNQTRLAAYALSGTSKAARGADGPVPAHQHSADAQFREELIAEIRASHCDRVLLSNEHCSSKLVEDEPIERLKGLLDCIGETQRVFLYLRRQDDFLLSSYSTAVKTGRQATFALPNSRVLEKRYNFLRLIERWARIFGEGTVQPRVFEKEQFAEGDLLIDFCRALNIDTARLTLSQAPRNTSLSANALEFLRILNVQLGAGPRDPKTRNAVVKMLTAIDSGQRLSMAADARRAFMARFEAGNAIIAQRYLGRGDGKLFSAIKDDAPDVPMPVLAPEAFSKIAAQMIFALAARKRAPPIVREPGQRRDRRPL